MTDRDRILQKTNGGLDVFIHYMGDCCTKKAFRNPFRGDSNPSCHLYYHEDRHGGEGRYILKDFGDSSWIGDCFWLVGQLTGLNEQTDFRKILLTIDRECELFILDDSPSDSHPVIVSTVHPKPADSSVISFEPKYRHFNKKELEYWHSYGITLDTLERYDVRSLSSCLFTRADGTIFTIYSSLESPMFSYNFNEGKGIKTYRPKVQTGRFMYAGNLPKPYVFGLGQLNPLPVISLPFVDILSAKCIFVTGGEKDVMSLSSRGLDAICLNSETARMPSPLFHRLAQLYQYIVFLYDCDETGVRESSLRVNECKDFIQEACSGSILRNVLRITLPLSGTKSEKDISDFFRLGHSVDELDALVASALESPSGTSWQSEKPCVLYTTSCSDL